MTMTKPVTLTAKEAEALMWASAEMVDLVDPSESRAVAEMLNRGWPHASIRKAGTELENIAAVRVLPATIGMAVRDALIVAVENTTWIECYRTADQTKDSPGHINEALVTLRSLATKLDTLGIEINHIPYD